MAAAARFVLVAALALALAAPALSYPMLWVVEDAKDCTSHPEMGEGTHGNPVADKKTTFTLVAADDATPAKSLCPGVAYNVSIAWNVPDEKRRALLTTNAGAFAQGNETCKFQQAYTKKTQNASEAFEDVLTIACNETAKNVKLSVTSAAGKKAAFQQADATFPVAALADCPTSTCASKEKPAAGAEKPAAGAEKPAAAAKSGAGVAAAPAMWGAAAAAVLAALAL